MEGLRPLTALELEGRDIYIREGCVGCYSQMIRPLRSETQRYGHYSVSGEMVYDHPFLFGSKRAGLGVWRRLLPWAGRLGRPDRPSRVFAIGMLWGWLPCGLVYSALATASTTGTAASGALFMLGFGIGTLPAVVLASTLGSTSRGLLRSQATRWAAACLLALFGLWTLSGALGPLLGPGAGHHRHAPVPDVAADPIPASTPPSTIAPE